MVQSESENRGVASFATMSAPALPISSAGAVLKARWNR